MLVQKLRLTMEQHSDEITTLLPKHSNFSSGSGVTHFVQTAPNTSGRPSIINENKIINVNILQKLNNTKRDNRGPKVSIVVPNGASKNGYDTGGFSSNAGYRTARNMSARNTLSKKGSHASIKRDRNVPSNQNALQFKSLRDSIGVKSSADSKINYKGNTMSV